jgi:peptide/nickel transport system substrate-binding protein
MKFKNLIRVLLSAVLVFGFSSAMAKTIKWSMQGDSLTLDPHAQNEGPTTQVSRQVYEALIQRGVDMKIGPALAKSWKTTDPNTWVFDLREDVKFSNGSKMTSEDVVFSILRAKQRTSDFKEYISTIS